MKYLLHLLFLLQEIINQIPFYPLPPLLFLALTGWTLIHIMSLRPAEAWASMAVIAIATILYAVLRDKRPPGP